MRAQRSPLSEEVKAEPGAEVVAGPASLRRECCGRTYLRGLFLAGGSALAGPPGYLLATLAELAMRLDPTEWVVGQRMRRVMDEATR